MQYDDLTLDGYRYDVRVLSTPLEYLHFLSVTGKRPGAGGPIGMEAVIQQDLEWQVESKRSTCTGSCANDPADPPARADWS